MPKNVLNIHSIDNGFCRVMYSAKNEDNQTVYYCLQDEGENYGGVILYRCTQDGEPDYPCRFDSGAGWDIFEVPQGDSDIEKVVRNFLEKQIE